MATSQQMRTWYPEFVVGGVDSMWNVTGTRPICDWSTGIKVNFLASAAMGGSVDLIVHPATADAFRALAAVFRAWNYEFRERSGGSVSCRKITGGTRTTLHAHGVAMDINPTANSYRVSVGAIQWGRQTDMDPTMIAAIEAIRTVGGQPIFQWGGRWSNIKDPMHFECSRCSRADLEKGIDWSTVPNRPDLRRRMYYVNEYAGHPFEYKGMGDVPSRWAVEHWQKIFVDIDPSLAPEFAKDHPSGDQRGAYNQATKDAMVRFGGATAVGPNEEAKIMHAWHAAMNVAPPDTSEYATKSEVAALATVVGGKSDKGHTHNGTVTVK